MVYLSEQAKQKNLDMDIPILLDPTLLRAARRIYRTYCSLHSKLTQRPFGVAINRETHRGQLIFNAKPILLPGECFVSIKQLESEIY
ncbi:hypothetical protein [Gloeothece verrucosa]|uniref:Uncharacterized protein n=1 Tax=Gloeothece verrucosa (strain PCC 7822) TaxID=497965 RepID=E0UBZ1_GLOV7|nr:hypothetical protein [Gloeothece verrucosa]ADN15206.1 conserved hypothetical protein [Gloeothece verrucosa PCC 7822]